MSSSITINGIKYSGNSIVVSNGKVIIDGKNETPKDSKEININVNGNIDELKVDVCETIKITGDVNNVKTQSGDVDVKGNVNGNIQTMSGDVKSKNVGGSISTMSGDIKHKR